MSTTGSTLGLMTSSVLAIRAGASPSHGEGLKSNQKAISYPTTEKSLLVNHSNKEKLKTDCKNLKKYLEHSTLLNQ